MRIAKKIFNIVNKSHLEILLDFFFSLLSCFIISAAEVELDDYYYYGNLIKKNIRRMTKGIVTPKIRPILAVVEVSLSPLTVRDELATLKSGSELMLAETKLLTEEKSSLGSPERVEVTMREPDRMEWRRTLLLSADLRR